MAINDRDFYASHGISFDIEEMQIEYTKRVINQAKIEVLTELQMEIDEKATELCDDGWWLTYNNLIQEKINKLKGEQDERGAK